METYKKFKVYHDVNQNPIIVQATKVIVEDRTNNLFFYNDSNLVSVFSDGFWLYWETFCE